MHACKHPSLVDRLENLLLASEAVLLLLGMITYFATPKTGSLGEKVMNVALMSMVVCSIIVAFVYQFKLFRQTNTASLRMELRVITAEIKHKHKIDSAILQDCKKPTKIILVNNTKNF